MKKGQLSTEYLVILAVVVIIALIVVTILGGFIDIGGGASTQSSKAYWRGADIGLLNWKVIPTGDDSQFTVRNNLDHTIIIDSMSVDGEEVLSASVKIPSGKQSQVAGDIDVCTLGDAYSVPVVFTYNDTDHDINELSFTGVKNLEGNC